MVEGKYVVMKVSKTRADKRTIASPILTYPFVPIVGIRIIIVATQHKAANSAERVTNLSFESFIYKFHPLFFIHNITL